MEKRSSNFESALGALEKIVRDLERGDLPLEDSLKLFEEGVKLSRECQMRLNEAERSIEVLLKDSNGNPLVSPIEVEELENSDEADDHLSAF
jgi:exodeoxyribonuclease VII small subunit